MMHTGGVVDWPAKSTDAELLVAAGRDPNAFGGLYDRHAASVLRWALRSGLSEADALDLVSEVFARAWIHRRRFHDPGDGNAAPWLFGIARHSSRHIEGAAGSSNEPGGGSGSPCPKPTTARRWSTVSTPVRNVRRSIERWPGYPGATPPPCGSE
jgi:hypothetical protein